MIFNRPSARQVEDDSRAFADAATDACIAARLLCEAVNLAEAQSGALADRLGGEERIEDAVQYFGRNADAEAMLRTIKSTWGVENAYTFAAIYAQWGDVAKGLDWLETAVRLRDSGLVELKTDPDLDPLRSEPRFQAIERALKFPN